MSDEKYQAGQTMHGISFLIPEYRQTPPKKSRTQQIRRIAVASPAESTQASAKPAPAAKEHRGLVAQMEKVHNTLSHALHKEAPKEAQAAAEDDEWKEGTGGFAFTPSSPPKRTPKAIRLGHTDGESPTISKRMVFFLIGSGLMAGTTLVALQWVGESTARATTTVDPVVPFDPKSVAALVPVAPIPTEPSGASDALDRMEPAAELTGPEQPAVAFWSEFASLRTPLFSVATALQAGNSRLNEMASGAEEEAAAEDANAQVGEGAAPVEAQVDPALVAPTPPAEEQQPSDVVAANTAPNTNAVEEPSKPESVPGEQRSSDNATAWNVSETAPTALTKEQLGDTFRGASRQYSNCAELKDDPSKSVSMKIGMRIEPTGHVEDVVILNSDVAITPFGQCIAAETATLKFPTFSGSPMKIKVPFQF